MKQTRREILRAGSAVAAGLAAESLLRSDEPRGPASNEITVKITEGVNRFAEAQPLQWSKIARNRAAIVEIDVTKRYQEILGFGAAFTDASCYLFSRMSRESREHLFRELFHSSRMSLNVGRLCIGASDYSRNVYSFDEGEPDKELRRFSIDHDREYILPVLKAARDVSPKMFLLGSPWSPPGWMKESKTMLGGCMLKSSYDPYARYLVKFLQAYAAAGVPVNAITIQNEVDTNQDGNMPACQWGQEYEVEFVGQHLGPELEKNRLDTKIWVVDHNYNLWGRAIGELDDPKANRYIDGVAWHGYLGEPGAMTRVHDAHPDKNAYWTEGGPAYNDPAYQTNWADWASTFTGILRNWARCIIGWNFALDESGKPNIGPFDCGGVVTIHSKTGEVTRSGQYWAFAHFSQAVRRGARRVDSKGDIAGVTHAVFANPDSSYAAVLTNNSTATEELALRLGNQQATAKLPAKSVTTLIWKA